MPGGSGALLSPHAGRTFAAPAAPAIAPIVLRASRRFIVAPHLEMVRPGPYTERGHRSVTIQAAPSHIPSAVPIPEAIATRRMWETGFRQKPRNVVTSSG